MAQPSDSSALIALKLAAKRNPSGADREKTKKLADKATIEIKDDRARLSFSRVVDHLRQRQRLVEIGEAKEAPTDDVLILGRFGMVRSAEFLASEMSDALAEMSLVEILRAAPSPRFIETIANKRKGISNAALELITTETGVADRSGAVDWLVQHGKATEMAKIAPLLISKRERLPHLAPFDKLLAVALRRDKGGVLLQAALAATAEESSAGGRILATLTGDPKLTAQFLKSVPKLLTTEHSNFAVQVLESWLPRYAALPVPAREPLVSSLATLAIGLLKKLKRNESQQRTLDLLSRSLSHSLSKMKDAADFDRFWIFARASDLAQSLTGSTHITQFGAGLVASTMEKAATGISSDALLEALALNLGLAPLASPGAKAAFNPEIHEDSMGGLLPNDPIVVRTSGWALEGKLVRRAVVTPP